MKRRLVVGGVAAVLVVAGLAGGRMLLRKMTFFQVRRIELVGARYLGAAEVTRALRLPERFSVFDATGSLPSRVAALPGVLEAKVSRRLPGALRVEVREAEPVALTERGGRLVLLDAAGQALPFDPTTPAADLPLADPDSAVAGLLARLRESDPDLFGRVQRAVRYRQDVLLDLSPGRILFRAGASTEEIRDLVLVAGLLARRERSWKELDARFLPRVIVRSSGA